MNAFSQEQQDAFKAMVNTPEAQAFRAKFASPEEAQRLATASSDAVEKASAAWLVANQLKTAAPAVLETPAAQQQTSTAASATAAPVIVSASVKSSDEDNAYFARKFGVEKLDKEFGIPPEMSESYLNENGIGSLRTILPILTQASVAARKRAAADDSSGEPARQRPRLQPPTEQAASASSATRADLEARAAMFRNLVSNVSTFAG